MIDPIARDLIYALRVYAKSKGYILDESALSTVTIPVTASKQIEVPVMFLVIKGVVGGE